MRDEDGALLAAISNGSEQAFNILIDRHQQAVRGFLRTLLSNAADADDIAQETFLAAWTQAKSYRGEAEARTWLCAIAWRKAKSYQRSWFRRLVREHHYFEAADEAGHHPNAEARIAARQALASLPLDQRAAVTLCLACGLTHTEAAEALGAPLGTVKSYVTRGRERLLAVLGEEE